VGSGDVTAPRSAWRVPPCRPPCTKRRWNRADRRLAGQLGRQLTRAVPFPEERVAIVLAGLARLQARGGGVGTSHSEPPRPDRTAAAIARAGDRGALSERVLCAAATSRRSLRSGCWRRRRFNDHARQRLCRCQTLVSRLPRSQMRPPLRRNRATVGFEQRVLVRSAAGGEQFGGSCRPSSRGGRGRDLEQRSSEW
jgi:hypothetical protein